MAPFFPVIYAGFWINAISGTGLFITYPVKAVTNPIFYLKMTGVVLALVCVRKIKQELFGAPGRPGDPALLARAKRPAATMLVTWVVTITAGRLLAYKGVPAIEVMASIGMAVVAAVAAGVWYLAARFRAPRARAADYAPTTAK